MDFRTVELLRGKSSQRAARGRYDVDSKRIIVSRVVRTSSCRRMRSSVGSEQRFP